MLRSRKSRSESQSALEYMMTYGWAILIIVIVAAVLYSFGIFNPASNVTNTPLITGFADVPVTTAAANSSFFEITLTDQTGAPITVQEVNITVNGQTFSAGNCSAVQLSTGQYETCYVKGSYPQSISALGVITYSQTVGVSPETLFSRGTIRMSRVSGPLFSSQETFSLVATTFMETSLPSGNWTVVFDGQSKTLNAGSSIIFTTSAGNYPFIVENISNSTNVVCTDYIANSSDGILTAGASKAISFSPKSSNCIFTTFVSSGLPNKYLWNVTYSGESFSSDSNRIIFPSSGMTNFSVPAASNSSFDPTGHYCTTDYVPSVLSGNVYAGNTQSITYSPSTSCKYVIYVSDSDGSASVLSGTKKIGEVPYGLPNSIDWFFDNNTGKLYVDPPGPLLLKSMPTETIWTPLYGLNVSSGIETTASILSISDYNANPFYINYLQLEGTRTQSGLAQKTGYYYSYSTDLGPASNLNRSTVYATDISSGTITDVVNISNDYYRFSPSPILPVAYSSSSGELFVPWITQSAGLCTDNTTWALSEITGTSSSTITILDNKITQNSNTNQCNSEVLPGPASLDEASGIIFEPFIAFNYTVGASLLNGTYLLEIPVSSSNLSAAQFISDSHKLDGFTCGVSVLSGDAALTSVSQFDPKDGLGYALTLDTCNTLYTNYSLYSYNASSLGGTTSFVLNMSASTPLNITPFYSRSSGLFFVYYSQSTSNPAQPARFIVVNNSAVLYNNTVSTYTSSLFYDGKSRLFYGEYPSGAVTINATSGATTSIPQAVSSPIMSLNSVYYNPSDGLVYMTAGSSGHQGIIYIINGTSIIGQVPGGLDPVNIYYG